MTAALEQRPTELPDGATDARVALVQALERLRLPFPVWYEVVYLARDTEGERAMAARLSLTPAEREDLARYRSSKRRAEYLAGRLAAKKAAACALGRTGCSTLEILRQPNGAPWVKRHRALRISIAHSARLAVAAVAYHPIGLDLELETQRPRELARWFFSPDELHQLSTKSGADWHALANLLWTRKEAVAKVGQWGSGLVFAQLDCTTPRVSVGSTALRVKSIRTRRYVLSVAHEERPGDPDG